MSFDEFFDAGLSEIKKGDRVEIVGPDNTVVVGPLIVRTVIFVIGDWIHLTKEDGSTYMEGNVFSGNHRAKTSHLPNGWRFRKLACA